jgi:hypothetical protein
MGELKDDSLFLGSLRVCYFVYWENTLTPPFENDNGGAEICQLALSPQGFTVLFCSLGKDALLGKHVKTLKTLLDTLRQTFKILLISRCRIYRPM